MLTHSARTSNKQSFTSSGEDLWQWAKRSEAALTGTSSEPAELERPTSAIAGWARAFLWLRGISSREPGKSNLRSRRIGRL